MIGYKKKQEQQQQTASVATDSVQITSKKEKTGKKGYEFRVQKDLEELEKKWSDNLTFPEQGKLNFFQLKLIPDDGIWKNHPHNFDISIPEEYPIKPPKVLCTTKVFHPNIDPEGHVCLNILREDWKPVLTLNAIFTGLHFLFLEPNPDDPLDKEAADVYEKDLSKFTRIAQNYMQGRYVKY